MIKKFNKVQNSSSPVTNNQRSYYFTRGFMLRQIIQRPSERRRQVRSDAFARIAGVFSGINGAAKTGRQRRGDKSVRHVSQRWAKPRDDRQRGRISLDTDGNVSHLCM